MKKYLFLLACLMCFTLSKAQITISSADLAGANDSVLVSVTNTIGATNSALTGANYSWDYSTLTHNAQHYVKFDAPSTFPSIYALLFNPFNTTYGKENPNLTSLPIPGISFTAAYDFFKKSTTQLKQIGAGYIINGTPLPFLYTSSDIVNVLPMHYLNTDSCDYKFGLQIPTIGYYGEKGHRVNLVDGWGTLQTPFGIFQTLRTKSIITSTDTLYLDAFSFGSNIPRPKKVEYKWFATGKKIPVLEIDGTINGTITTVTNVQYIDSLVTTRMNTLTDDFTNSVLFPNPTSNNSTFIYYLKASSSVKISLHNYMGQIVLILTNEIKPQGVNQLELNFSSLNLTNGIYFLTLEINNVKEVKKILISGK